MESTDHGNLGHYRLLERIGSGGMGEVFRARDTKLEREVALKLLPTAVTADPERHARFHREARSMAAFNHPNVAAIHALEEDGDRHFLVMELVEGEDLAQLLGRGPLPVAQALTIARRMAVGLEAAHVLGIVHRDLKPANVKITPEGDVKLLDFGLAKVFDDAASEVGQDDPTLTSAHTMAGVVLGTAAYMSPEQARGRPVDKRTDIWAFGAVFFEMLTGRRAFTGDTVTDTLAAVLRTDPPWPELPRDLPAPVARLLHRCLQKDRQRRLHDVADARIVLEDLEAGDGPYGPDSSFAGLAEVGLTASAPSGAPARRVPLIALATVAVAAVAVAAALGLRLTPAPDPPRMDILTFSGRDWSPSASPDGAVIAFASDRDGVSRIWLKQLAGGGETPLTGGSDDLPRFSPDGSQILFVHDVGRQRDLYRVPALGGAPRKIVNDVVEADWSPDGSQVAFLRPVARGNENITTLGIASLQTGEERMLCSVVNQLVYGVRWSPDGRWIAVNRTSLTGNAATLAGIRLVDPRTGDVRELTVTGDPAPYAAVAWTPRGDALVVGQAADLLSHVQGRSGLIVETPLDPPAPRPVAWVSLRLPRGGFGYSTLAVLDRSRLVLDESLTRAELHEIFLETGETTRVLTRGLSRDRQPAFAPDGNLVIFSSNRSGNVDLWVLDRSTGEIRQFTDDTASDWDPSFAADGEHVLWSSDRGGNMEVWIAALDGTGARQVTRDGRDAENPTMTPDGEWIVYASGHEEKIGIWKIRSDGTDATLLVAGSYLLPEVSPDGHYATCTRIQDLDYLIEVIDLETGEMLPLSIEIEVLSRNEDLVYGRARWTPDGSGIVFLGQNAEGRSGVFIQDFAPGGGTDHTRRPLGGFSDLHTTESLGLSPDGRSLIISATFEQRTLKLVQDLDLTLWR